MQHIYDFQAIHFFLLGICAHRQLTGWIPNQEKVRNLMSLQTQLDSQPILLAKHIKQHGLNLSGS